MTTEKSGTMKRAALTIVGAAATAMLGAYLAQPPRAQAVTATGADAAAIVDALKEVSRNLERIQRSLDDAGRNCRR